MDAGNNENKNKNAWVANLCDVHSPPPPTKKPVELTQISVGVWDEVATSSLSELLSLSQTAA